MKIGTLLGGAAVVTTISGQAQCDEYMVIGTPGTANPLQAIQVEVGGKTVLNINSAALITAWMKYLVEALNGAVGFIVKISTGQINQSTTYRLTNAGATVPDIYVFSDSEDGVPLEVASKTINSNSAETFRKFSALFLETPANLSYADVRFRHDTGRKDGSGKRIVSYHTEQLSSFELNALFSLTNQADATGTLGTVTVIDNSRQTIDEVTIYTNGVGNLTVLVARIPNELIKSLK